MESPETLCIFGPETTSLSKLDPVGTREGLSHEPSPVQIAKKPIGVNV